MTTTTVPQVPLRQDAAIIALVGLAHATSHFAHLLLPLMFPVFLQEFHLGYAQLGLLTSVFFVVSGLGQAGAGFVVDRFGARVPLLGAITLFALACLVAAQAQGYPTLLLVAVLAGLGNAGFHPIDFSILNQRVSGARLGYAFSVHGLSGNLGWAAAPVVLVGVQQGLGWRQAYLVAALIFALVFSLLLTQGRRLHTEPHHGLTAHEADGSAASGLAFMRLPVVWWCFAFFLFSTMTLAVVQNFSVPILRALHGIDYTHANWTLTAYMLCGAAGMLVGGVLAARLPRSDAVVATVMTLAAVLLMLCASGWLGALGTMVTLAATGFAIGMGGPSRDMMIKRATPKGATGRVYGLVYSGLDTGLALSPALFGGWIDRGWHQATLLGAAALLLLGVVAALGVGLRTRRAASAMQSVAV